MFTLQPLYLSRRLAAHFLRVSRAIGILTLYCSGLVSAQAHEQHLDVRATFERVYVPAYSKVLTHEGSSQLLATTMVVHNVDPEKKIKIMLVDFFDRSGMKVKSFLSEPVTLEPFGSQSFLVSINEQVGGFGANYLVEWMADEPALPPAVESVMIGGSGTLGLSFSSTGIVIERRP